MRIIGVLFAVAACSSTARPQTGVAATEPVTHPAVSRPDACTSFKEQECGTKPDCHAEYGWPLECRGNECAATSFGFVACHEGKTANCKKPDSACDDPDPKCAEHGDYRVLWIGGCHEGCVLAKDCAAG
jgi:hypothetical protein